MKSGSRLRFAFVLSLVPSFALAAEPSLVEWARQRVENGLVKPLGERDGSRFSRERPAPRERRVRVLKDTVTPDKAGRNFVPFAIDVRYGEEWKEDIVGCVYEGSGNLFVKRGDAYRPAAFLLGKKAEPVPNVCREATTKS
jgi:hypothetical protein